MNTDQGGGRTALITCAGNAMTEMVAGVVSKAARVVLHMTVMATNRPFVGRG